MQRAPLWLMKATLPGRAIVAANVAFSPVTGLITPRQLGPMIRIFPGRASSRFAFEFAPARPGLLEACGDDDGAATPASTHSRMMSGTVGAGVTMTARSTCSGTRLPMDRP